MWGQRLPGHRLFLSLFMLGGVTAGTFSTNKSTSHICKVVFKQIKGSLGWGWGHGRHLLGFGKWLLLYLIVKTDPKTFPTCMWAYGYGQRQYEETLQELWTPYIFQVPGKLLIPEAQVSCIAQREGTQLADGKDTQTSLSCTVSLSCLGIFLCFSTGRRNGENLISVKLHRYTTGPHPRILGQIFHQYNLR